MAGQGQRLVKVSVRLTLEQRRRLEALAEEEAITMSEMARRAIDRGLATMAAESEGAGNVG